MQPPFSTLEQLSDAIMSTENHVTRPIARSAVIASKTQIDAIATETAENSFADAMMGTDPPIEEAHPGLQPALVFASYPLMLIVLVAIVGFYFLFLRPIASNSDVPSVRTESSDQGTSIDNAR